MPSKNSKARKKLLANNDYLKAYIMLAIMLCSTDSSEAANDGPVDPANLPQECPMPSSKGANADKITEVPIFPEFPGIKALNVTNVKKHCTWKKVGINKGRICCWDDVWRFLKYEHDNTRLLEMYHIMLVRNNFNLAAPKVEYIINDGQLAISSERILDLTVAKNLIRDDKAMYRKKIIDKIGEQGFAQLHAVSSIISDTIAPENWGYNKNGLVLIDVDGGKFPKTHSKNGTSMQPKTLPEFLALGQSVFQFDPSRHAFSLNNLVEMQKIYAEMINKPVPRLHPAVDMKDNLYKDIFSNYANVFGKVIEKIKVEFPDIPADKPNIDYNDRISWGLGDRIKEIDERPLIDTSLLHPEDKAADLQLTPGSVLPNINNGSTQLANLTASVIMLASQTILTPQNNSTVQSLIANTTAVIANTTAAAVKVAAVAAEVVSNPRNEITNEMIYKRIDGIDHHMDKIGSQNVMFHTVMLLLTTVTFGSWLAYRNRTPIAAFFGIKIPHTPPKKIKTLAEIIIEGANTNPGGTSQNQGTTTHRYFSLTPTGTSRVLDPHKQPRNVVSKTWNPPRKK